MGDVLSILEAAYAETADGEAWIASALEVIYPHLNRGHGVWAHRYQHRVGRIWVSKVHNLGVGATTFGSFASALDFIHGMFPQLDWSKVYPSKPTVAWTSDLVDAARIIEMVAMVRERLPKSAPLPAGSDSLGVIAGDPSGHGCIFFTTPEERRVTKRGTMSGALSPKALAHWKRIAIHLVAGHRLARQREATVEAVLSPAGKVLHLEGHDAKEHGEALGEATRAIDRARGALRRTDPERAVRIWRDLVAGRWSLVDHFDHDGRRFVVAKRNEPNARSWAALTEREGRVVAHLAQGHSHKEIAGAMGISVATVAADLAGARTKMGARTRIELAASYRAEHEEGETPPPEAPKR